MRKVATLKDVATRAGVSTATVARVIHRTGYVADETREAIEQVLRETGYSLNAIAQGLKKQRTYTIGHLLNSIVPNPFFARVALGVEQEALENGCSVLMYNTQGNPERQLAGLQTLIQRRVDAIIFTTPFNEATIESAVAAGIPVVQVERPTCIETHTVTVDNYVGSIAAVEHLIELGHRRIAYIGADLTEKGKDGDECKENDVEAERFSGYLDALKKHDLPIDTALIGFGDYYSLEDDMSTGAGYLFTRQFLDLSQRPTAIFATCDMLAAGALQAIYERSLRAPDDISVIGFDNTYAPYLSPPLTTVEQPMEEIGRVATRIVLEQLRHDPADQLPFRVERLTTRLIVRSSTGPVREA